MGHGTRMKLHWIIRTTKNTGTFRAVIPRLIWGGNSGAFLGGEESIETLDEEAETNNSTTKSQLLCQTLGNSFAEKFSNAAALQDAPRSGRRTRLSRRLVNAAQFLLCVHSSCSALVRIVLPHIESEDETKTKQSKDFPLRCRHRCHSLTSSLPNLCVLDRGVSSHNLARSLGLKQLRSLGLKQLRPAAATDSGLEICKSLGWPCGSWGRRRACVELQKTRTLQSVFSKSFLQPELDEKRHLRTTPPTRIRQAAHWIKQRFPHRVCSLDVGS